MMRIVRLFAAVHLEARSNSRLAVNTTAVCEQSNKLNFNI